jgi:anti-anti-sigma regulatory factor
VWQKVESSDSLRLVVCDLSNVPHIDVAGARMLSTLQKDLASRTTILRLAEAHSHVRDLLRAEGLEQQVGYFGRHLSLDEAVSCPDEPKLK